MLTFVCDQCGATGSARVPGSARCTACGYVALVRAPAGWSWPTPDQDPFAASSSESARKAADVGRAAEAPRERRATLWIPPGPEATPTTDPIPVFVTRRPRSLNRAVIAVALLAGSAAVALAAAVVAFVPRWLESSGEGSGPTPAPVQQLAPPAPTQLSALPRETASTAEVRASKTKRAHVAATQTPSLKGALINPAPVDRRCVPRALRARPDLAGRLPGEIAVRFRVTASGDVARIEVPGMSDRDLSDAVAEAVRSCQFSPGTDENGRPIALPIVMRIRFAAPPEATAGF